jgi:putative membrane-bound dehydrogenase-like protein
MLQRILLIVTIVTFILPSAEGAELSARSDGDTISIYRSGEDEPILTQNAREDFRPYIHPIVAPDGGGVLTEYSPGHHKHQTGLYWGFTQVNGRDYFHHPEGDYWRRVSATILKPNSTATDLNVRWQTIYDLLDAAGDPILRETQIWDMREVDGAFILELTWAGDAFTDITIGEYEYGGMFLRMPWREGMNGRAVNSIRQTNDRAEGQRAMWVDVGMQVEGRDDMAHIAIYDHKENPGFPQPWRVDGELGVGPVRARLGDWTIESGETATIKHRLRVYTEKFSDVFLTEDWASYAGAGSDKYEGEETAAQWELAVAEGYRAEFLTPERAVEAMTVQDGFEVKVFAAEPMITQPMAFCWDDRGRMWIAENRDYAGRGAGSTFSGESRVSILEDTDGDGVADTKKVFLERVLNPSAMAVGLDGLWLGAIPDLLFVPDRDGDDVADEDDIEVRLTGWGNRDMHEILNSLHWGPDGWLYGLQGVFTPSLVGRPAGADAEYKTPSERSPALARKGGSGKGEPVLGKTFDTSFYGTKVSWTFLEGGTFELSIPDQTEPLVGTYVQKGRNVYVKAEQFSEAFIFDGEKLAFAEEDPYDETRYDYADEPTRINGGVWRYHPTKDRFEVVAHGLSNPWGIDYDAKGQFFVSACVIPHLWHVVQGGLYHRQAGSHFNPYAYTDIRTIGDHRHRSAHGGARFYLSDAYPDEYYGQMFMGNIHEHAVLTDILDRKGSGFVGRHGSDFMLANNAQFVGFSTEIGPAGDVYMLDWHDADICGGRVQTKETGRVFRLSPLESEAENWDGRYDDLRTMNDETLVALQTSKSAWHARRARVILQNRSLKGDLESETHGALREMFDTNGNADHRLRALWALHVTGGADETFLVGSLSDRDEYVRAWAIQLLCEDMAPSHGARAQFVKMAKLDESAVVRLYLASALQRMDLEDRWPIAEHLVTHGQDADDHNIPKLLWYGVEPLVVGDADRALKLAGQSEIPVITQHIARRLTDAEMLTSLVDEIGRETAVRDLLLLGMRDGLDGPNEASAPTNWPTVYATLRANGGEAASIALQLSLQFGDAVAADALVATLGDDSTNVEDRLTAIRGLAARKRAELKPQLVALLDDDLLRSEAIRAMASFDDASLSSALLARYDSFSAGDKQEAVHTLAARPDYGTALTNAIESGQVPRRDVPSYVARLLSRVVGTRFLEVWGPVEGMSADSEAAFAKFNTILAGDALAGGDPRKGREVFNSTCFACHQMYGEGGTVGPDLTGANRTDIDYLLSNIVTPSDIIQDEYKMTMIFTEDGQVYSGIIEGEDDRQLQLRIANVDEPLTIAKSQITDRETTALSMMPEGLMDYLSDQEVIDLFAYLGTLEPVLMQDVAKR